MDYTNKLISAERLNSSEKITGFYYQIIPPSNPVLRLLVRNQNFLNTSNNSLTPRHYILQQENLGLNLPSVKSFRIKPETMREATEKEIEEYIKKHVTYANDY